MDNNEEEDTIFDFASNYNAFFEDTAMGEPEEDVEDHLGQMLCEAEEVCETKKGTKRSKAYVGEL